MRRTRHTKSHNKINRSIRYLAGILLLLAVIAGLCRCLKEPEAGVWGSGQKTESDLGIFGIGWGLSGDGQENEAQEEGKENGQDSVIRVLLMTTGYTEALHDSVSLSAEGGLLLSWGDQEEQWTEGILTLAPDDSRFAEGKVTVKTLQSGDEIRVESIERGRGIPSYQGTIEVWSGEEGMAVINELPVEQYLCRVVPSEMPAAYEPEALKAQAICARSYALRQMESQAYPEYQAHVNDSTEFQVYNNSYPAETVSAAVEATAGQVIRYQGNVAAAYYYSTSCGRTTTMEAWGDAANEGNAYLQSVQVSGEDGDYEKGLPWYRWQARIPADTLAGLIADYAGQNPGTLSGVEVTRRGPGGVAVCLVATGSEAAVTVETENRIRQALGGDGYQITKNDGQTVDSQKLLPSAFFTITCEDGVYILEGGGYGHGIGMSQNGANEMAKEGKTCEEILHLFYQGVTIG